MIYRKDVTDAVISKAGLERGEAKVIRVYYDLASAGGENSRTRRWVASLNHRKHSLLLRNGRAKIAKMLEEKESRAGK